jgi:two-component system nitrate/nitrite response regulator NarP
MEDAAAIDIALADGNPLMLAALADFVDRDKGFSLVTTAATAENFLAAVGRVPVQVGLIDWTLPVMGGERLLETLRLRPSPPRMIVYGAPDEPEILRRAMAAGAAGFSPRHQPPEQLLVMARAVARGQMMFPFVDVRELNRDPAAALTLRERTLLAALARGLDNKSLARELDISVNTVKFHLRNLYEKLNLASRAQAIAFYYSSGAHRDDKTSR